MEEESNTNQVSKELFGSKIELRKIFETYIQVFRNVRMVVDDYYNNRNQYARPVKYALSVIAPYVIVIQVFDLDIAGLLIEAGKQANDYSTIAVDNPEILKFYDRYYQVMRGYTKLIIEFLPVFYALIFLPILAFWMKMIFRYNKLKFSYYYALGTYTMMTSTSITFLFFLITYFKIIPINIYLIVSSAFSALFFMYGIFTTFQTGMLKGIFKSVLVLGVSFITYVIPLAIILVTITALTM